MNYEQSNVGPGMVPHCAKCSCDECRIERLASQMESANRAVQLERGKVEKADRENDRLTRGLAEAREAARVWENEAERRSRRYEKCAVELATVTEQRDVAEANLARLQQRWDERPLSAADRPEADPAADYRFAEWLAREMPPGTIIGDPNWWAPRILRGVERARATDNSPSQPEAITFPEGMSVAERIGDPRIDGAADDSIDGRCPITGEPDGGPHPDAPARAYWPADNSPAIRPHDTGPDYQHGPGCLCRYCDDK